MRKPGVIETSKAELASLIVAVPKYDGKIRFCVDCRTLSAVTQKGFISNTENGRLY